MYSAITPKSPASLSNTAPNSSVKFRRFSDVTHKAWNYCLDALREPTRLPFLAYSCTAKKAHLGELLGMNKLRDWLTARGIRTVLDVGANSGQFASATRCVLPDAQIYSFEPLPECHDELVRRLQPYGHFKSFCVALGRETGETTFWKCPFSKSSSLLRMTKLHENAFPWTAHSTATHVKQETLDHYVGQLELNPGVLLKLDVQGNELGVLEGARELLRQVQYVQVETSFAPLYDGQASFGDVYQLLDQSGFEYAGSSGQTFSPLTGDILQEDAFFRRRIG